MLEQLLNKEKSLAVVGLGYVGLPIALEFAKKIKVIGFDIHEHRVEMLRNAEDPSKELEKEAFDGTDIEFTANADDLAKASFFIVAVPTPVDEHKVPDLTALKAASMTIGKAISKGDCVVYESTVYPGCTEEDCLPIVEEHSGLKAGVDFSFGYSPERINPGDKEHTISKILKVVSGNDEQALDMIASVYEIAIKAGVFKASSVKVAEAAKIIENTQRDLNIALMNELSKIFDKLDIDTYDVLRAAGTKWNFLPFFPGLVGGHCIGVDPYYLTYKANSLGYKPEVILSGRRINDSMAAYVAKRTVQLLLKEDKRVAHARILVMGATFKEDVSDIRNSKIVDLINELQSFQADVELVDPHADPDEIREEYSVELTERIGKGYDAIIVAVNHREYANLDEAWFTSKMKKPGIVIDVKGIYKNAFKDLRYWSL